MAAATMVGVGLQAVSMIAEGQSQAQAQRAQADADRRNAGEMDRQAREIRDSGAFELDRQSEQAADLAGRQRAAIGSSGFTAAGSMAGLQRDSAVQAELDRLAIIYNTELQATGRQREGAELRRTAGQRDRNARSAMLGGILGAGATAAGGYGDWYTKSRSMGGTG